MPYRKGDEGILIVSILEYDYMITHTAWKDSKSFGFQRAVTETDGTMCPSHMDKYLRYAFHCTTMLRCLSEFLNGTRDMLLNGRLLYVWSKANLTCIPHGTCFLQGSLKYWLLQVESFVTPYAQQETRNGCKILPFSAH